MKKTTLLILVVSILVFTVNLYAVGNGDVDKKASAKSSKAKISDDRKTDSGNNGSTPQGYGYGSGYGEDPTKPTDRPGNDGDPFNHPWKVSPYDEKLDTESGYKTKECGIWIYFKRLLGLD